MIRFGELTDDEVFVSHEAAVQGVTFENTGLEPLVSLRYFGPHTNIDAPAIGDYKKKNGNQEPIYMATLTLSFAVRSKLWAYPIAWIFLFSTATFSFAQPPSLSDKIVP